MIDYAIVTLKCFNLLRGFEITNLDRIYSDGHSFLQLQIKLINSKHESITNQDKPTRPSLKNSEYQTYVENFDFEKMDELLSNMQDHERASTDEINEFITQITHTFHEAALRTKPNNAPKNPAPDPTNKPWFGQHCKTARKKYYLAKRIHHCNKSDENKENMLTASKLYKITMNIYINKYAKSKQSRLRTRGPMVL